MNKKKKRCELKAFQLIYDQFILKWTPNRRNYDEDAQISK